MWILPKNISDTSHSVVGTRESEMDSEKFSEMCERSLMWRSKPSLSPTWLRRWKRNKWIQHLCSRTLKSSRSESFVDAWTSYLGDSPANHSAQQGSERELMTQDTSSPTSLKESESANQQLSFSKMLRESSVPKQQTENQFSSMSFGAWRSWVIEQRQEYSVRLKLEHHTKGSEYLSWPTARTSDAEGGRIKTELTDNGFRSLRAKSNQWFGAKLRDAVETHEETWPTPTTRDWKDGMSVPPSRKNPSKQTLGQRIAHVNQENWATPNTMDGMAARSEEALRRQAATTRKGRKNPANLREQVDPKAVEIYKEENWPTPTVAEGGKIGNNPNYGQLGLSNHPKVHGYELTREKMIKSGKEPDGPQDLTKNSAGGKSQGQLLNPNWVEQLMGLEPQWTQLPTDWID